MALHNRSSMEDDFEDEPVVRRPDRLRIRSINTHINEFGLDSIYDAVDLDAERDESPVQGRYSRGQIRWNAFFSPQTRLSEIEPEPKVTFADEIRHKLPSFSSFRNAPPSPRKPSTAQDWSRKMSVFPRPWTASHSRQSSQDLDDIPRRSSEALSEAFSNVLSTFDPLQTKGNPLNMEINETRRLSSVSSASSHTFCGPRLSLNIQSYIPTRRTSSFRISDYYTHARHSTLVEDPDLQNSSDQPMRRPSSVSNFSRPFATQPKSTFTTLKPMMEEDSDYVIQRLPTRGDVEQMSLLARICHRLVPLLSLACFGAFGFYMALRVLYALEVDRNEGRIFWMAWTFMGAELFLALPLTLQRLSKWLAVGSVSRPKLRIVGNSVPSVDVIILCDGEDHDIILDTARAACNIDYPSNRFRVLVCDDSKSKGLSQAVIDLVDSGFENLYYRSRPKYNDMPQDFRAGNLNYALEETNHLSGGAASFLAVLDANMMPTRDWLRALLPHMLQDRKCSMACPPKMYYNIPIDDPLCQRSNTLVHLSEPIQDALGIAWCTGSGYVLRREALEAIGGFPTGSMTEESCCSNMLLGSGWRTAFIDEPLQWGMVTNSLCGYLQQQRRKTFGAMKTSRKLNFGFFGAYVRYLTISQRLSCFFYTMGSLSTIVLILSMLAVPVVLIAQGELVPYTTLDQLRWLLRASFISIVLNRLTDLVAYLSAGSPTGQRQIRAMMWMAPFHTMSMIRALLFPKNFKNQSTEPKADDPVKSGFYDDDPRKSSPFIQRLKTAFKDCQIVVHLLYFTVVLVAVAFNTYWCVITPKNKSLPAKLEAVLTHAAWPPLIWLTCASSFWTPVSYALFPPSIPDREDLLQRDLKTGVAYPTNAAKTKRDSWWSWFDEFQSFIITAYAGLLFALTFAYRPGNEPRELVFGGIGI